MARGAAATDYRRSLDLNTAIARTAFRVGNIRYAREVFASPIDQVIVCRLTAAEPNPAASAPGRITATVAMSTPMSATVRTEGTDTLVLAGVNGGAFGIKGALTYQARVRVLIDGGSVSADGTQLRIIATKSATLLIAAATSYRRYDDVSGDPAAATRQVIAAASARPLVGDQCRRMDTPTSQSLEQHPCNFRRWRCGESYPPGGFTFKSDPKRIDINGNENIEAIEGEGGAVTAYQHAFYMTDLAIFP